MNDKQSPIFSKTYDFTLWLLNHTENFPKSERFRMAKWLEDTIFKFHELLVRAARARRPYPILSDAVVELDKVRQYMRLSAARQLTNQNQYIHAAERLTEIGKILGGWMRSVTESKKQVQ